ncbi:matrixin family metalloprotease [Candidatus Nitrosotenuis aquarius]|uniref:matrixin family metalloprotease n=1 Tax=Candidatus Nitrosotenuis aquarius TaxID=1846278 RepID=UPI000C1EC48D|nr:matrixin family metalloprotease [Candidatus Nitrosotenuis aquarius]
MDDHRHILNEKEQEKILLEANIQELDNEAQKLRAKTQDLEKNLDQKIHQCNELEQEKILLVENIHQNRFTKKHYLLIVAISAFIIPVVVFSTPLKSYESELTSKYVIENLRGDTIDTWIAWKIPDGTALDVNIIGEDKISSDKITAIKNSILSDAVLEIDDSLLHKGPKGIVSKYYDGWKGALVKASETPTSLHIPTKFSIIQSNTGEGDIIIKLTNERNTDGYTGYTKSVVEDNQILKSTITIYNVDNLTVDELSTIARHEFGHALGLAHSTAPEDLMAPTIISAYPYISECNIDAIVSLYDGNQSGRVRCEK